MFKFLISIFLIPLIFSLQAVAKDKVVLPIATEHYPPYEMLEPIAGLKGFDYEVMVEIFTRLGYELAVEFYPWKRALSYTKQGKVVGILTCAYNEDRDDYMLYSDPISTRTDGYFVRTGFTGPKPTVLEDVKGQRVASVKAYASLKELIDAGLNPISSNDTKAAIGMLQKARFDYLYLNQQSTDFIINQLNLTGKFEFYPIAIKDFYFCFSKKYKGVNEIINKFNNTLKIIRTDGTYKKIHNKYR